MGSRWGKGFHPRTSYMEGGGMNHSSREIWEAALEDWRRAWPWGWPVTLSRPQAWDMTEQTSLPISSAQPPLLSSNCLSLR